MLGIVCGIESEAVLARKIPGASVVCAAAQPAKARVMARELIKNGAKRLMSFGIAGGLEPGLPLGSLIIADRVQSASGTWVCDALWATSTRLELPYAFGGGVWGSETLVSSVAEKHALYAQSQCRIADMESQCVAEVAAEAGVPMLVVRAVCDHAGMDVPPMVMEAVSEDGSIDVARALWSLVRQPKQIPALVQVGQGTNAALTQLRKALPFLGLTSPRP